MEAINIDAGNNFLPLRQEPIEQKQNDHFQVIEDRKPIQETENSVNERSGDKIAETGTATEPRITKSPSGRSNWPDQRNLQYERRR